MARAFLTSIDLSQNELLNGVIHNAGTAPADPIEGQIYCNTTDHNIYIYLNGAWETWVNAALLGAANGVATLNASSLVVQNPANAQTTPAADKIPLANGSGKIDNGWLNTGAGNGLDADTLDGQHGTYYLNRANHTGTQTASTISDFDTQVRTNRLDQMAVPTASINLNGQLITNLATPVTGTDAANKDYVDSISQGLDPKQSVKAATTIASGNIVLNGPLNVDGISLVAGDRVLVKNQTLPEENGIYVVQTGAWTRASDTDTWAELVSAYVFVEQGTVNSDSGWLCTVDAGGTLGTTAVSWVQFSQAGTVTGTNVGTGAVSVFKQKNGATLEFRTIDDTTSVNATQTGDVITFDVLPAGIDINQLGGTPLTVANGGTGAATAAGAKTNLGFPTKYSEDIGDGSAKVFVITHNLGTRDVLVQVRQTASPYAVVEPDIEMTSTNTITLRFNKAPTSAQYRVTIIG
jgi:hypothetical protein